MKILYMGTPDFAAISLDAIVRAGHEIVAVVTREDKPRGRGHKLTPTPVKTYAAAHGIDVYQPQTLRDDAFAELLSKLSPELIVVAAYGKILPDNVLGFPKYGCINVHASLLPKYRGADPIRCAIKDGMTETGVTIMKMASGLDTGDMISSQAVEITRDDTFETLHDKLAEVGASLLVKTIGDICEGRATYTPQDDARSSYAPKTEKADCMIDFSLGAKQIRDLIRAMNPFPYAFTVLGDKIIKVASAEISAGSKKDTAPGCVISLDRDIVVSCGGGEALALTEVIPAGKGKMSAADFIRGRNIRLGDVFASPEKGENNVL